MKALVIVPDIGRYGGTSCFLERLLVIHARQRIVTTLLIPADQYHSALASLVSRYGVELIQSPCRVVPNTVPFLTPLYDFLFSWLTVRNSCPDLIVISTGDPGRLSISFYFPIPVLYILHSIPEQRFRILPRLYLWLGSMLNNCVMAVSNAAAESISDTMGIPRSRVEIIHNSSGVAPHRNEADTPIVLTAGHLVPYKNPGIWLEVARRVLQEFPDTLFVWLGDGELLEAIREKVRGMHLERQILLPGYVPNPSTWYAKAHIYFQPSLRESHGIAVLEAMAHGLPCVVSNTGGLPESVINGETGYVCPPANPDIYVGCITKLLADADLRECMGTSGQQRVARCFSEELQEHKIMDIYRRLVNKKCDR